MVNKAGRQGPTNVHKLSAASTHVSWQVTTYTQTHTQKREKTKSTNTNTRTSYILLSVNSHPKTFRIFRGFVLMEDLRLKLKREPGNITQLRVLAAFSEDLGSVPSTHMDKDM